MQPKPLKAGTTGLYQVTDASPAVVSGVRLRIDGLSGSVTPQTRIMRDGHPGTLPLPVDCLYSNFATGAGASAGTAITADGEYVFDTSGSELWFNVSSVASDCTLYVEPIAGAVVVGGSNSGAVTVADGADVALGTTTDAAVGDATGTVNAHVRNMNKLLAPGAATVAQTSLSTTAAQIVASNTSRKGLVIKNIDSAIVVYLGTSSGVTSANGYPLSAGESVTLSASTSAWYGIAASSTPKVAAIEV